jgi:hypothetical protein
VAEQVGPSETLQDASSVGAIRPAPHAFVHFAAKHGLLDHGQSLRLQKRPWGWCLTHGGDQHYTSCPPRTDPIAWLMQLVRGHREFERQERLAGRGPLSARLRVMRGHQPHRKQPRPPQRHSP